MCALIPYPQLNGCSIVSVRDSSSLPLPSANLASKRLCFPAILDSQPSRFMTSPIRLAAAKAPQLTPFVPAPPFAQDAPSFQQDLFSKISSLLRLPWSLLKLVLHLGMLRTLEPRLLAPRQKSKRKAPANAQTSSSQQRRTDSGPTANSPAMVGVGPSGATADAAAAASDTVFHLSLVNIRVVNYSSLVDKGAGAGAAASDVWFFVRGVHSSAAPTAPLRPLEVSTKRPVKKAFSHLACRFCKAEQWKPRRTLTARLTA
ncbi:Dimer-Tnp-hAT domain-containing protein [Mycena sanguinolenta]|uniref:Dimer-Tnp-hAT domain-containing protein n=1 Tax=Mycena sanguinolenta TaxID=230812 RepID=A0A8H7CS87_9AGAR|nr:Dimer-Tnp-hAT domain-containing protein [Mycena sanguinolenta]